MLQIKNLHASIHKTPILNGVDLTIQSGETHVIMGPNGSGKSTLANVLMGNPIFTVTDGKIIFEDINILETDPEERAAAGLFMAFQYPREIAGVQLDRFLFMAYSTIVKVQGKESEILGVFDFNKKLEALAEELKMKPELVHRALNVGFSGGEKKKAEMLQLGILPSKFAILDETDSGLDVDALKIVAEAINKYKTPEKSILIITHYNRILECVRPDFVHVMVNGTIVKSGGKELVGKLEEAGYEEFVAQMNADR